jgi:hypothetical protein
MTSRIVANRALSRLFGRFSGARGRKIDAGAARL